MRYAVELGLRGLLRQPRTMGMAILLLAFGLAAIMTMLSLLTMLSADPLPGLSGQLHLAWVDSRQAERSGTEAVMGAPESLWKIADTEAIAQPGIRQAALMETTLDR